MPLPLALTYLPLSLVYLDHLRVKKLLQIYIWNKFIFGVLHFSRPRYYLLKENFVLFPRSRIWYTLRSTPSLWLSPCINLHSPLPLIIFIPSIPSSYLLTLSISLACCIVVFYLKESSPSLDN